MSNTRYTVNEKNIYDIDFELLYISKSKYGDDWHSTSHSHPFTEIFFITHGFGFMIPQAVLMLTAGLHTYTLAWTKHEESDQEH